MKDDTQLPALSLPGKVTKTSWQLPKNLPFEIWLQCGEVLDKIEGSVQWWRGDWWNAGERYGDRVEQIEKLGLDHGLMRVYGSVAAAYPDVLSRDNTLTFTHHRYAMSAPAEERQWWLEQAEKNEWSANKLKSEIAQGAAFQRTKSTELDAKRLGKFVVLYADPPWRYENPPMGGSNRSIENQYPTMELEQICELPVADLAHENSVLFLWATSPKLYECMKVLDAWGFTYRTDMVWVKDKIGMGYHVRGKHESLLIAKKGELPPPAAEDRPDSVVEAPRLEHSAKPPEFYEIIDRMYPGVRKIELFGRAPEKRKLWAAWGNQA